MTEQEFDGINARLDYLEAAMKAERREAYMPYAEFVRTIPNGLPPEVAELANSGQEAKATLQLAKLTGISAGVARVAVLFAEFRKNHG